MKYKILLLSIFLLAAPLLGFAQIRNTIILSPQCNEAKIKEIAGSGTLSIKEMPMPKTTFTREGKIVPRPMHMKVYMIKHDEKQLSFDTLTKRLSAAGCLMDPKKT